MLLHLPPLAVLALQMGPLAGSHRGSPMGLVRPATAFPYRCRPVVMGEQDPHCTVIFLRHGQSTWNEASLFTGWADVELTTLGKNEAARAATDLWRAGLKTDVAYTSLLTRAQQTLDIVLHITGQQDVTVHRDWRLNERMYGGLTGLNKKETAEKYGADQVKVWRRSYSTRPPDIDTSSQYWPGNDNTYAHIPMADIPLAECLKDTVERTLPYWDGSIAPALRRGKTVLICAHGNSIRGMLKAIDGISDDEIVELEIPTGVPLVYELNADLKPIARDGAKPPLRGVFLGDADEIARAQRQVAEQSKVRYGEAQTKDAEVQFLCVGSGCLMLSNDEMREAFDKVDLDGNGRIDSTELYAVIDGLTDDAEEPTSMDEVRGARRNHKGAACPGCAPHALLGTRPLTHLPTPCHPCLCPASARRPQVEKMIRMVDRDGGKLQPSPTSEKCVPLETCNAT